jgi:hypothetical protein
MPRLTIVATYWIEMERPAVAALKPRSLLTQPGNTASGKPIVR